MSNSTRFMLLGAATLAIAGLVGYTLMSSSVAQDEEAPPPTEDEVEDVDVAEKKSSRLSAAPTVAEVEKEAKAIATAAPAAVPAAVPAAAPAAAAPAAPVAAGTPAAPVAAGTPATEAVDTAAADAAAAEKAAQKEEFANVTRLGTKFMKAQAYDRAAKEFGRAIVLAEALDVPQASVETLYNNRAAMHEKGGDLAASLDDCTVVLAMNASHTKVRKRRARIYAAQGRMQDALVEYCAVLVADTVEMRTRLAPFQDHPQIFAQQQQKIMEEKGAEAQATQEKLQETMQLCGKAKADGVLAAREKAGGLPHTGNITSAESSVFQLLLSYTEYLDQEASSRAADLASLTHNVKLANSAAAEAALASDGNSGSCAAMESVRPQLAALQARALHFMAKRQYAKASDDLMAAFAAFESAESAAAAAAAASSSSGSSSSGAAAPLLGGEAAVECATLLRWVALFHHVRYDLAGALAVYARAAALAAAHPQALATVEVMRSGVHVDLGSLPDAEAALTRAAALAPTSVDVLMHRSQLWLLTPDLDASEVDIRACLEARPAHVVAQLRLAMMLISQAQTLAQGNSGPQAEAKLQEAEDAVAVAKQSRPDMSEVFQVLGSIKEVKGDVAGAMAAHDKAIALDPKNPTPYINKGMLLAQVSQPASQEDAVSQGAAIMELYAQAIAVDPLCSQAHKLLAEMKLRFASQFSETEAIVSQLEAAIEQCRDPAELVELCTFCCIAAAQLEAARDLGMSSFADLNA